MNVGEAITEAMQAQRRLDYYHMVRYVYCDGSNEDFEFLLDSFVDTSYVEV